MSRDSETVCIIAGGWSASQVDLARLPGTIIGVNDAALCAPRCDIALSMDRLWTENRFHYLRIRAMPAWLRRSAVQNIKERPAWLHVFDNDHTSTVLSDAPNRLDGTHSGFCALNLAYQLRPSRVFLVGFDMQRGPAGEAHWFKPYPWVRKGGATGAGRLAEWSGQFVGAARQCRDAGIDVVNVSTRSAIRGVFRTIGPRELADLQAA